MITYEELGAAVIVIAAVCSAIVLFNNTRKAVDDMKKPFDDLKRMVLEHDLALKKGDDRMERQDDAIEMLLANDLLIMQHLAYGNHNEQLKSQIDTVQDFLIKARQQ